ncbi:FAD-dependent oxidoreductase [bacterium]|nr:FAD-dependent oxidoreductase [bacterium]
MKNAYISYKKNPSLLPTKSDVIVIGSGLGGLTTALELSKKGFKVLVLEQHFQTGGYAHSFQRKNYQFDVSLHHIGGLRPEHSIYKILDSLGVLSKLEITPKKTIFSVQLPEFNLTVPNTKDGFKETISSIFPHEKEGIEELFKLLIRLRQEIMEPWTEEDYHPPENPIVPKYIQSTFGDIVSEFIKDSVLKSLLAQFWTLIGLPPDRVTSTFAVCVFNSYFLEGSFDIKGGGTTLSNAMIERLAEAGSHCFTDAKVATIMLDGNKKAVGVTLADGQEITAPIVISNASPFHLIDELLPSDALKPIFRHRVKAMVPSISFFVTYIGLDCHPSTLGIPESTFFFNHQSNPEMAYQKALQNDITHTDWAMTSYENSSIVSHPAHGGILSIVEVTQGKRWIDMSSEEYKKEKKETADILLDKYNKRFPGLKKHAVIHEFSTPRTMERYTGNTEGAIYGLAQLPEQSNSKRLRNITPIENLYLTGAWTWAGGGYEGAIMSGVQTAISVLSQHSAPLVEEEMPEEKRATYDMDSYYKQSILVYPRDVASGRLAPTTTILRFMDRGRVDAGEEILHIAGLESLFTHFNIQVYSIELNRIGNLHAGDLITLYTKYYKRSDLRAVCHQVITDTDGHIITDAMVDLVQLNEEKQLDNIPDVITDICTLAPLFPPLQNSKLAIKMRTKFVDSTIRIYTEDSDLLGVVFHVNYLRFSHQSLFDYLHTHRTEGETWTHWVYKRFHIRYLNSTHVGEDIVVSLSVRKSEGKLILDQMITLASTGKTVTQINSDPEFRDENGNATPLPQALLDLLGE